MSKQARALYEARVASAKGASSFGAMGLGALAAGAVAGGAVAIGALAIRSLAIKRGKIQHLSIGDLEVRRLRVRELVVEEERDAPHPFRYLEGHSYISLTTFRKSGEPVSTPIWFALHEGRIYATTEPDSGKMKRLRNNPSVLLAPCNAWGKESGERVEGVGRSVEEEPTGDAEATLRKKYRLGLRLIKLFGQPEIGKIVLEVRPADSGDEPQQQKSDQA
ncbi:MAG: PPOX class F420-dependent oxidoreductase [Rubrobacteraceae bacterium]